VAQVPVAAPPLLLVPLLPPPLLPLLPLPPQLVAQVPLLAETRHIPAPLLQVWQADDAVHLPAHVASPG
jgi:hypothetical protein